MQNKAICAVSFRNAIAMPYQIRQKQCSISRNSQAVHSRRISCTVSCSRADLSSRMQSSLLHSRTIDSSRSSLSRFLLCQSVPHCAVIPYSDFSLTEQGRAKRKQPELTCPGLLSARSAILKKSNCTKYVFVEIHKTKKTAYLLAFCKHAEFPTNFSNRFLPESCDLYCV